MKEIKKIACKISKLFNVVFVAWNIALTEKRMVIIDGNWNFGFRIFEVLHGQPLNQTRYSDLYDAWMRRITDDAVRDHS